MKPKVKNALYYSLSLFIIIGLVMGVLVAIMVGFLTLLETDIVLASVVAGFAFAVFIFVSLFRFVWVRLDNEGEYKNEGF